MCSIAWKFHDGGYELRFNRDEKWARPESADPTFESAQEAPGACARDAAAGGTWLFTNECGVTLAVMNAYPEGVQPSPGRCSRGLIPLMAAKFRYIDAVSSVFSHCHLGSFAPFEAILVGEGEFHRFGWDGNSCSALPPPPRNFLTTSSIDSEKVKVARYHRYDSIASLPMSSIITDDYYEVNPAEAIHVTREDGGTVSQTTVIVSSSGIRFAVQRRSGPLREILFPRKS